MGGGGGERERGGGERRERERERERERDEKKRQGIPYRLVHAQTQVVTDKKIGNFTIKLGQS